MSKIWAIWLLFLPVFLNAQADFEPLPIDKESYRGYISFSVGPSFPFGAFERKDLILTDGGYAKSGLSIQLDFGYRFYENLIVSAQYVKISNPFDEEAIVKQAVGICLACDPPLNFSQASASSYELNAFLSGIGFVKEMSNLSVQMQFMIGYGNMYTPRVELSNSTEQLTLASNKASNLAYGVGSGMRIHLTDQLDFSLFGTFLLYQADFDQTIDYMGTTELLPASLRYQVFNLNFGLAYRIIKKTDESEYKLKY